jgi:hypothetical protein
MYKLCVSDVTSIATFLLCENRKRVAEDEIPRSRELIFFISSANQI